MVKKECVMQKLAPSLVLLLKPMLLHVCITEKDIWAIFILRF